MLQVTGVRDEKPLIECCKSTGHLEKLDRISGYCDVSGETWKHAYSQEDASHMTFTLLQQILVTPYLVSLPYQSHAVRVSRVI